MWRLVKTSQFIRGAASGMALLTFLAQYSPFAVLDMATLVHHILMLWNDAVAQLGEFISGLVGMPSIPPEIANAVIIGLSVGPVWSYTILKSEWGTHRGLVQNAAFWTRAAIGCLDGFVVAMIAIIVRSGPILYVTIATLLLLIITVLSRMPTFRKGFIFILGVLVASEGIYFVSTPAVRSAFDEFVCGGEGSNAPRCQRTTEPEKREENRVLHN